LIRGERNGQKIHLPEKFEKVSSSKRKRDRVSLETACLLGGGGIKSQGGQGTSGSHKKKSYDGTDGAQVSN